MDDRGFRGRWLREALKRPSRETWTLLSWNVNGRVGDLFARQLDQVLERKPDVLALQEVKLSSYPAWCERLTSEGYSVVSAVDLARLPYPKVTPAIRRTYFNLTASIFPLAQLPGLIFSNPREARVAFPEKYVAARIALGHDSVEVHNAHLPPGSTRGEIKIQAFRAIRRRVDNAVTAARVLCGDFNTPRSEDEHGVTTWAGAHPKLRDPWDKAERSILEHPVFRDVYRERHHRGAEFPVSHVTRGIGRRYDHIYASRKIDVVTCNYLEDWRREQQLSDHAPVEAKFVRP